MDKIDELVEWVAKQLYADGAMTEDTTNTWWKMLPKFKQRGFRERAKEILSHPDLAMKGDRGFIYLAEAIKERDGDSIQDKHGDTRH